MMAHENIFDPAHYAKVRLPHLQAETLPTWCYRSQAFYDREVERMFKKSWNFLGREDEVPDPGDYKCFEMFGESIVVLRDRAGDVRAFANTCRHRGTRLLRDRGNCRAITCPYHAWSYALTGELIATPGMEKTFNFDRAEYGLVPVRLETWDGLMFVTFDAACPKLLDYLGNLPKIMASYKLSEMVCVRQKEYELACNWKIYLENAMEEYHTPTVHRASIGKQTIQQLETVGEWDGGYMRSERTIALLPEDVNKAFPHVPGLDAKAANGTYFLVVYPAAFFIMTQDCMWWLQQLPLGPDRTKVVIGSCFPRPTVARPDFSDTVQSYYRRWDKSLPEDNHISETQQLGIRSSFSRPGRYSHLEPVVHKIANWVLDRVLDQACTQAGNHAP
ncbi:MAG TPA: aromatic ring-hydroxylating dioxygenase subunit alpha [Alphaproteobacteria bacterium]|nr:aromatic ring-hydroxylating dioxygenase subunit alpha [Alphaproteobacteria bacterium]